MKLNIADREIDRIGDNVETEFAIKGTGKAFRILSSGLYKDKILAVVRELSCNAFDAHIAAGCREVPFAVHLPNALEPFFSIRDFGIGLSHENIITLYSTYFESTKTDSNDFIGALGLGSKSPFSYVDSFTVISRFNGMKRSYASFINERGSPVTSLMAEEETTEGNGLEVIIPVCKSSDFPEFESRARQIYQRFAATPIVTGVGSFDIYRPEVLIEGSNYQIKTCHPTDAPSTYRAQKGAYAIMGNIAYPITAASIPDLTSASRSLIDNLDIDIHFALGDLEFTAGREELSYDPVATLPNLITTINAVSDDLATKLQGKIDDCASEIEARKVYYQLRSSNVFSAISSTLAWKSIPIDSSLMKISTKDIHVKSFRPVKRYDNFRMRVMEEEFNIDAGHNLIAYYKFVDQRLPARQRVLLFCKQNQKKTCLYFEVSDQTALDLLRTALCDMEMINCDTLPKPYTPPRRKVSIKSCDDGNISPSRNYDIDVDIEDGGFYVVTTNGTLRTGESTSSFMRKYTKAKACKIIDDAPFFVVPVSVSKAIIRHPKWIELTEYMREQAIAMTKDPKLAAMVAISSSLKEYKARIGTHYDAERTTTLLKHVAGISGASLFSEFSRLHEQSEESSKNATERSELLDLYHVPTPVGAKTRDIGDVYREITLRYPLIPIIAACGKDHFRPMAMAIDYVSLIDRDSSFQMAPSA